MLPNCACRSRCIYCTHIIHCVINHLFTLWFMITIQFFTCRTTWSSTADFRLDYSLFRFLRFVGRQSRIQNRGRRSLKSMRSEESTRVSSRLRARVCVFIRFHPGECEVQHKRDINIRSTKFRRRRVKEKERGGGEESSRGCIRQASYIIRNVGSDSHIIPLYVDR